MIKKFIANCNFSGKKHPVTLYVGDSFEGVHPLAFQSKWLGEQKGGEIPNDIMDSFSRLKDIADRNKVSFEELCSYVIDEINSQNSLVGDLQKAQELSAPKNTGDK